MKPTVEQLETLLALKRDERPEDGYWQGFVCEFHQRQREQALARTGLSGLRLRLGDWMKALKPMEWAYGAGIAYAAVTVAFLMMPRDAGVERATPVPVKYEVLPSPPTVEQLDQLDLSPSTQGSAGEVVF